RRKAQELAAAEEKARRQVERELRRAELARYALALNQARHAAQLHDFGRAAELLDHCQWNLRGWEHAYVADLLRRSMRTFHLPEANRDTLAWSPDGKFLATAVEGGITLWDAEDGTARQEFEGDENALRAIAFRPDGKRLVSGGNDNKLRLWNTGTGKRIRT